MLNTGNYAAIAATPKTGWPWPAPAGDGDTVQITREQLAAVRDLVEHVRGNYELTDSELVQTLDFVAEAVGLDSVE